MKSGAGSQMIGPCAGLAGDEMTSMSSAEGRFEPLTIESVPKNFTTALS